MGLRVRLAVCHVVVLIYHLVLWYAYGDHVFEPLRCALNIGHFTCSSYDIVI